MTWTPADGLYEGRVVACTSNTAYSLGDGHYSQPCYDKVIKHGGDDDEDDVDVIAQLTFVLHLPPGDGKIGGGA